LNNPLKYIDPTGNKTWFGNFFDWVNKGVDNLGKWWSKNNLPQVGVNVSGNGVVPYAGVQGPGNTTISIGYNLDTRLIGIGNNADGFTNFYYPGKNYDVAAQNAAAEVARVRAQDGAEWRAASNGVVPQLKGSESSRGYIVSVANGTVALGPVGVTADLGAVFDSYGQSQMYFTFGWAYGFGATAGVGYTSTNRNFKVDNYAGSASNVSLSVPYLRVVGIEGFGDYYEGATGVFQVGTKIKGLGVNLGVGSGWFGTQTYTILFSPPPPDFWLRPRPRW
jgi:hypothetical protein